MNQRDHTVDATIDDDLTIDIETLAVTRSDTQDQAPGPSGGPTNSEDSASPHFADDDLTIDVSTVTTISLPGAVPSSLSPDLDDDLTIDLGDRNSVV